jgi:hypothetical protein
VDGSSKDSVANEVHSRENNEWIEQMGDDFGWGEPVAPFKCECSAPDCRSTIYLTRNEYESVRLLGKQFVIKPRHENPEFDIVTEENANWAIVHKLPGDPTQIAESSDPRRHAGVTGSDRRPVS